MAASNANTKTDAMTATTIITVFDTPPFEGSAPAVEPDPEPELEPELGMAGCEPPELVALPTPLLPM